MKKITSIRSGIPQKLATPTDLNKGACKAVTDVINPLIADAFALYIKTKNYHWHVTGSHYRDYHLLLDEQAAQIFNMIDILAERIRKLGGTTIRSVDHVSRLTRIHDDNDAFVPPIEMIRRLLEDNKDYATHLREAHRICDENDDVATASVLEIFIDETERRTWFLYETQTD